MKHLPAAFYVRTPTPELWKMVQERLFSLGFSWYLNGQNFLDCWGVYGPYTHIKNGKECISYGEWKYRNEDIPEISIADLFLLSPEPKTKNIEIKGAPWKIELGPEVVSIGCCSFEKEELKKILGEIWNRDYKDRSERINFIIKANEEKWLYLYEGRNGLDVWMAGNFEHTVPWNAVEELLSAL